METNPALEVAATVRAELARKRISQTTLGEVLNLSQTAVSRRLGGRKAFDINELHAIARHLGIPLSALVGKVAA